MKTYKFFILILLICLSLSINVYAEEFCSKEDLVAFTNKASYINQTLDILYAQTSLAQIKFYNIPDELKIVEHESQLEAVFVTDSDYSLFGKMGWQAFDKLVFDVVPKKESCLNASVRKIEVTLPMYNSFSSNEICKEIPDYTYCANFIYEKNTLTEEEMLIAAKKYQENINAIKDNKSKDNSLDGIYTFVKGNWYYAAIIIVPIVAYFTYNKIMFKRKGLD